jgi:hypothetical protein
MLTRYQYVKAVKAAGGQEADVDPDAFRYPGPRPQSRETAILMLADGCEARVRAELPKDEDELRKIVKSVIDIRVQQGQLDDTNLTLRDLTLLVDSFTSTLRGVYHPRIQYPSLDAATGREPTLPLGSRPANALPGGGPADGRSESPAHSQTHRPDFEPAAAPQPQGAREQEPPAEEPETAPGSSPRGSSKGGPAASAAGSPSGSTT